MARQKGTNDADFLLMKGVDRKGVKIKGRTSG